MSDIVPASGGGGGGGTPLRQVFAQFNIQINGLTILQQARKEADGFATSLKRLVQFSALAAAGRGISRFISGTVAAATQLRMQAAELGVTTDELQRYEFAAEAAGVSSKDFAMAMRFLERNAGLAAMGMKGPAKAFGDLGIRATDAKGKVRPVFDLLGDLADYMAKNPDRAVAAAGRLISVFGRGGHVLVPILKQGRGALLELQKGFEATGGGINRDFLEASKKAQIQLAQFKYGLLTIKTALAGELLPYFGRAVEAFLAFARGTEWARVHTYGLTTALEFLTAAGIAFGVFRLVKLVAGLGMSATEALTAFLPWAGIAAIAAILYLTFDDIFTLLQGGKSVIGEFLDQTYGVGTSAQFAEDLRSALAGVQAAFHPLVEVAKEFGIAALGAFTSGLPTAIRVVVELLTAFVAGLDTAISGARMAYLLAKGITSGNLKEFDAAGDAWLERMKSYNKVIDALDGSPNYGGAPQTGGGGNGGTLQIPELTVEGRRGRGPTTNTVNLTQNFPGTADPKTVKDAAKSGVQIGLRDSDRGAYDDAHEAVQR